MTPQTMSNNLFDGNRAKKLAAAGGVGGMITGAVMVLALPFTAQHEGLRLKTYLDVGGVPTICYGETLNVSLGQTKTKDQCDQMLSARLGYFAWQVDAAVVPPMKPEMHAALASFAYNVGLANFQTSTLLQKLNSGDAVGACNQLPRWNKIKQNGTLVVSNGLTKRREAERQLCLKGI